MTCAEPAFDFGVALDTQRVCHDFVLFNGEATTVTVTRVHSTCGCVTSLLARHDIPPGETEPVTVWFDPKGRRGPQRRPVYVNWNGPDNQSQALRLALTGAVVPAVKTDPACADFGLVPATGLVERVVRFYDASSNRAFRIIGVTLQHESFGYRIDVVVPGHDYQLTIRSTGTRAAGTAVATTATVATDIPGYDAVIVPIFLRVKAEPGS